MTGNLKLLYDHLQQFEPTYHQISDTTNKKKITLESLNNEQFIDNHLKKDIMKLQNCRDIVFKTGSTTFRLSIHYKKETVDTLINLLMYMLSFVSMLSKHSMKDIHMTYYLLDVKRVLDGDSIFDKEEVNGGACSLLGDKCNITVWRKEEILKVSIHELIHGLSYDYKNDTAEIIQHYQRKYSITSKKMNTFEAYTEIWAELLHSYLITRLYNKSYDLFAANVGIEMEFSRIQATKVLALLDKNKDMNKETNVCSYYLIKMELYDDIQRFIGYCIKYNQDIIQLVDVSKYLEYLKELNKIIKKTLLFRMVKHSYLKETTRMTCLEIDLF